jgi:hypothetical protein
VSSPEQRPAGERTEERPPANGHSDGTGGDQSGDLHLEPIPAEGTAAPPDSERVFGKPPPTSPYARLAASNTPGKPAKPGTPAGPEHDGSAGASDPQEAGDQAGQVQAGPQQSGHQQSGDQQSGTAGSTPDASGTSGETPTPGRTEASGGTDSSAGTDTSTGTGSSAGTPGAGGPTPTSDRPGWPPAGPTSAPPPGGSEPPSADQLERARKQGRFALLFGIGGLLASLFLFPIGLSLGVAGIVFFLIGPGLGIAGIVFGVLARRVGRSSRVVVAGAVPGLALGIVATVFASLLSVVVVVFWNEAVDYQECMSGANTQTARDGCQQEVEQRIRERMGTPPPTR